MFLFLLLTSCAKSQEASPQLVGGRCEGCEAVFEYGDRELKAVDTLPEFESAADKLRLSGVIYEPDGKTPAEGVIIYINHTNAQGVYPRKGNEEGWGKNHGYLRGWAKTGKDGKFIFYTQVPGPYPGGTTPAHIHPYVLEPDGKYYWLESYFFEGDDLLSDEHVSSSPHGGTAGVVELKRQNGMYVINRDFILGKNIPEYQRKD